ncbi:UvrD-helicase domain-containing protein [Candidatus Saccharibacteria bacterium]|nr:UvrD-helicase domain-containing protein [Candidatus Saccharibacteria bacterium]
MRKIHNWRFLHRARKRTILCGGFPLDRQQIEAVVACEDAQLVLASAGSGKTMSLLAKIEYLYRELRIPAEQILAISFTKKTVDELAERCEVKGVEFRTFHGLGNSILHGAGRDFRGQTLISESETKSFLQQQVSKLPKLPDNKDFFVNQLQTFLSLHKNAQYSPADVIKREMVGSETVQAKAQQFLKIYFKIYFAYEEYLKTHHKYDFADMINCAEQTVRDYPNVARGYKYILLDEVQDLSRNRCLLIRAILQKNPGCKLFAVGDDWQSIYRFTGSDLTLIRDFETTFGLKTRHSLIETTHRFGNPTIRISSEFVQKNPTQSHKNVFNLRGKPTPIHVIFNRPKVRDDDTESLNIILQTIIDKHGYDRVRTKEFQIISRFNHDINRLTQSENLKIVKDSDSGTATIYWRSARSPTEIIKLEFCSMHKSKGITRDIVIVLNMNSNLMGMPARRETDPIIDRLLSHEDDYAFAEERRLFYVAITRAREATYLIANYEKPSPFVLEISDNEEK